MKKLLPDLKTQNPWLKASPSQSLQQKCFDLDIALKRVWKSGFGFPKFKSKNKSKDSFYIPQQNNHIKLTNTHIQIPKLGLVKYKKHREPIGILKSITVSRDVDHWYVSVLMEIPDVIPLPIDPVTCKSIGVD